MRTPFTHAMTPAEDFAFWDAVVCAIVLLAWGGYVVLGLLSEIVRPR